MADSIPSGGVGAADQGRVVTAYRDLRRGVGVLGLALPFALVIGHRGLLGSISAFYYTDMRNWFVGTLWAIGFFLIFYRYQRVDNILSNVAGALAILVALFPTTPAGHPTTTERVVGDLHLAFAACFLLLLAYFCLFLFTRSDLSAGARGRPKNIRNVVYRVSGVTIAAAVAAAGICELPPLASFRSSTDAVFWLESLAVVAFGVAWLVKGQTLFRDPRSSPAAAMEPAAPAAPGSRAADG